jgi:uncharacterized phosphatase
MGEITTTIYILRHGQTDWNVVGKLQGQEDIELNDVGRQQALETVQFFAKESIDVIVSTQLKRAYETAQIISEKLGVSEIHIVEDLIERCWGEASGLLPEERRSRFADGVIPGQEPFEDMRLRGMKALEKIARDFEGKTIVIVSHGGIINALLYSLSNAEYGSYKTRLKNASINKFVVENNSWHVEFYNKSVEELV